MPNQSELKQTVRPKRVSREVWAKRIADHMLTNGVANLSVRTMAAKYGVTAQALLNHFGSKEKLLQDVMSSAAYRDLLILEGLIGKMTSLDKLITDVVSELRRSSFRRTFAFQLELFARSAIDPGQYSDFARRLTKRAHMLFMEQARRDGVPAHRVEAVAGMVHTTIRGLVVEAVGGRRIEQMETVASELREWYSAQLPAAGKTGQAGCA